MREGKWRNESARFSVRPAGYWVSRQWIHVRTAKDGDRGVRITTSDNNWRDAARPDPLRSRSSGRRIIARAPLSLRSRTAHGVTNYSTPPPPPPNHSIIIVQRDRDTLTVWLESTTLFRRRFPVWYCEAGRLAIYGRSRVFISWLVRNAARPLADYFRTREVLNVYHICVQKQTDPVVFCLSVTYFQFRFPLSVCFCTMPIPNDVNY